MPAAPEIQVLVVGAGVGGLALAGFLDRAGLDPVVVDAAEARDGPDAALELGPDALAPLARLGLADAVRSAGTAVTSWTRRTPEGRVVERLDAADGDVPGFVAVGDRRLRDLLLGGLPGRAVRTGTALRALEPTSSDVTVEFANGVRERFDVVVGADGARSRTRDLLDDADPAAFLGTTSLAFPLGSDVDIDGDGARETWDRDGPVFRVLPTRGRPTGWLTLPAETPAGDRPDPPSPTDLVAGVEWLPTGALADPDPGRVRLVDDFRAGNDVWADGRVALLGDAAHARHRLAGVNPALALEDAAVLADELTRRADTLAARVADYAGRRRSRLRRLVGGTDADPTPARPLAGVDSPLAARLRTTVGVRSARLASRFDDSDPTPDA